MRKMLKITSVIVVLSVVLSVAAFAAETRASEYFDNYTAYVTKLSGGSIKISFNVVGMDTMSMLGASVIKVYDSNDKLVKTFTYTAYPEMMGSNVMKYSNSVTYSGTAGESYYAVVTFFAKNSSGYEYTYYTT